MAEVVYYLCAVTSFFCAALQMRAYLKTRTRFLLLTAICFLFIFINNVLLVVDFQTGPEVNLVIPRSLILLAGVGTLLWGFIGEVT